MKRGTASRRTVCSVLSAAALLGSGGYLLWGENTSAGIIAVLAAAIASRFLMITLGGIGRAD